MNDRSARIAGLAAAVLALRAGKLVAMPTETVYGLAADATNGEAVAGIFAVKGRPRFNPLIVHVGSLAEAEAIAEFSTEARRLGETFWPGPLTLVLPKRSDAPIADLVTAGLDTVAVRVPAHPVARDLIDAFGAPIAAPSANLSGHVSPTTAAHVAADLGDQVACILDAGASRIGVESTVVGLVQDKPMLLRPGGLSREVIEDCLGRELELPTAASGISAPGMLASHYAPAARLRLNATNVRPGEALLAFGPRLPETAERATAVKNLSDSGNLTEAAANLFAALRELDKTSLEIAVMAIPSGGLGEAINDRLQRAATPRDKG